MRSELFSKEGFSGMVIYSQTLLNSVQTYFFFLLKLRLFNKIVNKTGSAEFLCPVFVPFIKLTILSYQINWKQNRFFYTKHEFLAKYYGLRQRILLKLACCLFWIVVCSSYLMLLLLSDGRRIYERVCMFVCLFGFFLWKEMSSFFR